MDFELCTLALIYKVFLKCLSYYGKSALESVTLYFYSQVILLCFQMLWMFYTFQDMLAFQCQAFHLFFYMKALPALNSVFISLN